jgi:hypothetical protein
VGSLALVAEQTERDLGWHAKRPPRISRQDQRRMLQTLARLGQPTRKTRHKVSQLLLQPTADVLELAALSTGAHPDTAWDELVSLAISNNMIKAWAQHIGKALRWQRDLARNLDDDQLQALIERAMSLLEQVANDPEREAVSNLCRVVYLACGGRTPNRLQPTSPFVLDITDRLQVVRAMLPPEVLQYRPKDAQYEGLTIDIALRLLEGEYAHLTRVKS